jgi:hypothetical protein
LHSIHTYISNSISVSVEGLCFNFTGIVYKFGKSYQFHSFSPLQLVANVAIQLLILDLCMSFGFTTIVIAALMDAKTVEGSDEMKINSREASWLGNGCHEVEG